MAQEEVYVQVPPTKKDEEQEEVKHKRGLAVLEVVPKESKLKAPERARPVRGRSQRKDQALIKARKRLKQLEKQVKEISAQKVYLTEISELQDKVRQLEGGVVTLARLQQLQIESGYKNAATTRTMFQRQLEDSNQESIYSLKRMLKNIWFLRSLATASGVIISALLLAYSFIFLNTYVTFGNTTSYFPWSWHVPFDNIISVQALFYGALGISMVTLVACAIAFWYCLSSFRRRNRSGF